MTLRNDDELANTQRKLADLERLIAGAAGDVGQGADTEVRSLTRLANDLREEIIRYRASRTRPAQHRVS